MHKAAFRRVGLAMNSSFLVLYLSHPRSGWSRVSQLDLFTQRAHVHVYHVYVYMGVSVNGRSPIAGWFLMDNTIKMDDLGVPLFQENPIYIYI